jgi:hypothetical protein
MKNTLAIVALASCITALCRAASPPPVPESLLACRKLPDEGRRVRCYDAQIDKMSAPKATPAAVAQASAKAPAAVADPAGSAAAASSAAAAPQLSAAARFGQETLPPASRPTTQEEQTALLSSIKALHVVRPQQYAITLANGQVWRQIEASDIALFLHVGDDVRIEKGTLGSYRLSTSSTGAKNWVRVTRVQ